MTTKTIDLSIAKTTMAIKNWDKVCSEIRKSKINKNVRYYNNSTVSLFKLIKYMK